MPTYTVHGKRESRGIFYDPPYFQVRIAALSTAFSAVSAAAKKAYPPSDIE